MVREAHGRTRAKRAHGPARSAQTREARSLTDTQTHKRPSFAFPQSCDIYSRRCEVGSSNAGLGLFHLALLNQPSANGSLHGTVPLVVVMSRRRWRRASPSTTSDDAARARSALARSAPREARPPQTHFWWSCGGSCLQSRVRESSKQGRGRVCMCFDVSAGSRNAKFSSDARFARGALRAIR